MIQNSMIQNHSANVFLMNLIYQFGRVVREKSKSVGGQRLTGF